MYTLDEYWYEMFLEMSRGKFNKEIQVLDDKSISVKDFIIECTEPTVFIPEFIMHMKELGYKSPDDASPLPEEETNKTREDRKTPVSWKKIKSKATRNEQIVNYITRIQPMYNLTLKEKRQMYSSIQLAFLFHQISSDDIQSENGYIIGIEGLTFDEKNRIFFFPDRKKKGEDDDKKKTDKLSSLVESYFKGCKKIKY